MAFLQIFYQEKKQGKNVSSQTTMFKNVRNYILYLVHIHLNNLTNYSIDYIHNQQDNNYAYMFHFLLFYHIMNYILVVLQYFYCACVFHYHISHWRVYMKPNSPSLTSLKRKVRFYSIYTFI